MDNKERNMTLKLGPIKFRHHLNVLLKCKYVNYIDLGIKAVNVIQYNVVEHSQLENKRERGSSLKYCFSRSVSGEFSFTLCSGISRTLIICRV